MTKWHRDLPWQTIRLSYRWMRRNYFQVDRQEGEYLVVPASEIGRIEPALGQFSFAPNWEQSYYKGEVINLARVYYDERVFDDETILWWQTHARGFLHDDGSMWIRGHDEAEPTEYPVPHLDGVDYSIEKGLNDIAMYLDQAGILFDRDEWYREDDQ